MPGLFGGSNRAAAAAKSLAWEFSSVWPDYLRGESGGSFVGVHAFAPNSALLQTSSSQLCALDGDAGLLANVGAMPGSDVFLIEDNGIELRSSAVGNVAVLDNDAIYLATDWTGTCPLYYTELAGGLLFSSHLRPLARAVDAAPDMTGVLEFLRFGYTVGARTQYRDIHRLCAGQSLVFRPGQGVRITEHSRLWAGVEQDHSYPKIAAIAAGAALDSAMQSLPNDGPMALMMSGGWDSRSLLASAGSLDMKSRLRCYSHGDLASRELALAKSLAACAGLPWHAEPLDEQNYDLEFLGQAFGRTENLLFPHWHRAGRLLAEAGCRSVLAGVFGEMLGGRYWLAHTQFGVRKAATLFSNLLFGRYLAEPPMPAARVDAAVIFRLQFLRRPWYLNADAVGDEPRAVDQVNADIDEQFQRYERRGVATLNQFVEAFQGEHIGSRFCNVQLLSARAYLDVGFPLADRRVLEVATHVPLHARMQNGLNRKIIRARAPELLRLPMGATLVPASMPITVQEASRVVRKAVQMGQWSLHFATSGKIAAPSLAWANYEFLRRGSTLRTIVESLRADIWDRPALLAWVAKVESGQHEEQMLGTAEFLGKLMTTDLMLR
jgi:asparagine synthetase B (glutamine-hydrolysing)